MINTLTVEELINRLEQVEDKSLPVVSVVNYGDRCNTMQAVAVGELEESTLVTSAYSTSGYAVKEDVPADEDTAVLVLNYNEIY